MKSTFLKLLAVLLLVPSLALAEDASLASQFEGLTPAEIEAKMETMIEENPDLSAAIVAAAVRAATDQEADSSVINGIIRAAVEAGVSSEVVVRAAIQNGADAPEVVSTVLAAGNQSDAFEVISAALDEAPTAKQAIGQAAAQTLNRTGVAALGLTGKVRTTPNKNAGQENREATTIVQIVTTRNEGLALIATTRAQLAAQGLSNSLINAVMTQFETALRTDPQKLAQAVSVLDKLEEDLSDQGNAAIAIANALARLQQPASPSGSAPV